MLQLIDEDCTQMFTTVYNQVFMAFHAYNRVNWSNVEWMKLPSA